MTEYRFITHWIIEAPLADVFAAVFDTASWPQWWHGVESVEEISAGDAAGIGGTIRYTWKGRLPYHLVFDACATRIEAPRLLEATVSGDVEGTGRWIFSQEGSLTTVRYEWFVDTAKAWMKLVSPLARPVFRDNHDWLMEQGGIGLAERLGARLVGITHGEAPGDEIPVGTAAGAAMR